MACLARGTFPTRRPPPPPGTYSSRALTWRLTALLDTAATVGGKVCALHRVPNASGHGGDTFIVEDVVDASEPPF